MSTGGPNGSWVCFRPGVHHVIGLIAVVAAILLVVASSAQPAPPTSEVQKGWTLTFDDEFNGPAGSAPDSLRWLHDVGGTGWGNHELEYYTAGKDNTYLDGQGHLVITARRGGGGLSCWYGACAYTSGRLTTRQPQRATFAQGYGRFEARIQAPIGKGLWPAFWLLGEDIAYHGFPASGEIDVMEVKGDKPGEVNQHVNGPGLSFGSRVTLPAGQSVGDWHTYAIGWTPSRIDWYVDGRLTQSITKAQAGDGWVFDHPFFILLNLAVGGTWPGNPDGTARFPAVMRVDYVRVYDTKES